jgi:hypothetical protein
LGEIDTTLTGSSVVYCPTRTTIITYDNQGRLASESSPSCGGSGATYTYGADGSERIEHLYDTDVMSERRSIVERPPACVAIDADIGRPGDYRCRIP